jgi:hypothetical protein
MLLKIEKQLIEETLQLLNELPARLSRSVLNKWENREQVQVIEGQEDGVHPSTDSEPSA